MVVDIRQAMSPIFGPIDNFSTAAGSVIGLNMDQVRLLVVMAGHIPLGFGYRYIKGTLNRNLFGLFWGILTQIALYGNEFIPCLVFLTILYFVNMKFKEKAAPSVYFYGFAFLSFYHIKRMVQDYGGYGVEISLLLMQILMKITYAAWAINDLYKAQEKGVKDDKKLCRRYPTLLDYLSYNFNFVGICGPSTDLPDYIDFIDEERNYKDIKPAVKGYMKTLGFFVAFGALFGILTPKSYTLPEITGDKFYNEVPCYKKVFFMHLFSLLGRFKYYTVWFLGQLSVDSSGLSYSAEKNDYSRWVSCNVLQIEFNCDSKTRVGNWNLGTQRWLKSTFYQKWNSKLGKSKAALYTFVLSAFWHGFYPAYYIGFAYFHFSGEVQKIVYKNKEYLMGKEGTLLYNIKNFFLNVFYLHCTNLALLAFGSLRWDETYNFQRNSGVSILIPITGYALFTWMILKKQSKERKQVDYKKAQKAQEAKKEK